MKSIIKAAMVVLVVVVALSVLKTGADYIGNRMAGAVSELVAPLSLD